MQRGSETLAHARRTRIEDARGVSGCLSGIWIVGSSRLPTFGAGVRVIDRRARLVSTVGCCGFE
jgi:hypothetical protein